MELSEYKILANRTAKVFPDRVDNLRHAALGIVSEIGELQEVMVAAWLQLPFDPLNICEEGGDTSWYIAYLAETLGWNLEDLTLGSDELSESESLAAAVLTRNPIALVLVAGGFAGDVATLVKAHTVYGKPFDEQALKIKVSFLFSTVQLIMDIHGIDFLESCLPENIDKLKARYGDKYSDVAAMERKDKAAPSLIIQ